jgi:hypothetical protein
MLEQGACSGITVAVERGSAVVDSEAEGVSGVTEVLLDTSIRGLETELLDGNSMRPGDVLSSIQLTRPTGAFSVLEIALGSNEPHETGTTVDKKA